MNQYTKQPLQLTHDGLTMGVPRWAERTGLSDMTIYKRLNMGWEVARALTEPVDKAFLHGALAGQKISKNDAEQWLNSLPKEKLPKALRAFASDRVSSNHGSAIRIRCRPQWDEWYKQQYLKGDLS